ncbi:MAG: Rad52/22 double-strand break repair protein [Gemmatimonadetes bacterium]|nr:Rad52/22 double-strand break repair protein [Gemmatimonadota bacterium]
MIARHEANSQHVDAWTRLAAPLPAGVIFWRQDGRAVQRDGKYFARFVAYIEANTVRERLDGVVPGEWDLTLELMPTLTSDEPDETACSFKARLQILGVIREDVGTGRDYKQAATDAFKRAAVRFGIAHELYSYEQNWVQVDGEGRYAKPIEDPADAYARRSKRGRRVELAEPARDLGTTEEAAQDEGDAEPATTDALPSHEPSCPKCGGRMWDNRISKRNPKAPDFKCRTRSCDGVVWPASASTELKELPF